MRRIIDFISAVSTPKDYLNRLCSAKVHRNNRGEAIISNSQDMVSARITWHEKEFLLSMPLTPAGERAAHSAAITLSSVRSNLILGCKVLPCEMSYPNIKMTIEPIDLLLQEWPQGEPMADVMNLYSSEQLFDAADRLECELKRIHLSYSDLNINNIFVDYDCQLYPISMECRETKGEVCEESLSKLREQIALHFDTPVRAYDPAAHISAKPLCSLYGYSYVGNPFEGLSVAVNKDGYGYIDELGEVIIAPQFLWADDFKEGRAEVETLDGMGLIDSKGNYIIEPKYDIVEFDITTGHSRAKLEERWSIIDYNGVVLEEDVELEIC